MNFGMLQSEAGASAGTPRHALGYTMAHSDPFGESEDAERHDADADEDALAQPAESRLRQALDNDALATLIARVMRQDEAALSALYAQLSSRVYALALRVTRNAGSAEEVLQDTFWQVWRQAPRFDAQRGTASAWILTMARSRALDAVRALARDPTRAQAHDDDETIQRTESPDHDPLDLLEAVHRGSALHQELAKLDPLRRQLIAMAFFRGMTQDEIADHTGLPLGTVKSHFRRTLAALQTALGPQFSLSQAGSTR